jgi:LytS/YehU family sensor histidine kinase
MIKSMAVVAVSAYIFSQTKAFRSIMFQRISNKDEIMMIILFSGMSVLGTYMSIPVEGAYANTRSIGVVAAGLYGGPLIGGLVGLLAGLHRYTLGGFAAVACAISPIIEGLIGVFLTGIP